MARPPTREIREDDLRVRREVSVAAVAQPRGGVTDRASSLAAILLGIAEAYPEYCLKTRKWRETHEAIKEEYRAALRRHLCDFSVSTLSGALSAWRRYTSFLACLPKPAPPPFLLILLC